MDIEGLAFHHIGIACRDIEKTQAFYRGLGYSTSPITDDPVQRVKVAFMDKPGAPRVELLQPLDEQSPVARTLQASGVTPYHCCYSVEDITQAINTLKTQRFLQVSGPVVAPAINGHRIAFLYHKHIGLIELVEIPQSQS